MEYILITPTPIEPLTLDEVKQKLRLIGNNDFDTELTRLIATAREVCENITGRDLITKTYKLYIDCFSSEIEIRKSKLQSIISVKYYYNEVINTLANTEYYYTKSNDYSKIIFKNNINHDEIKQAIEIEFTAGYGITASTIPSGLKEAMLSYIDLLFNNCANDGAEANLFSQYMIAKKLFFTI